MNRPSPRPPPPAVVQDDGKRRRGETKTTTTWTAAAVSFVRRRRDRMRSLRTATDRARRRRRVRETTTAAPPTTCRLEPPRNTSHLLVGAGDVAVLELEVAGHVARLHLARRHAARRPVAILGRRADRGLAHVQTTTRSEWPRRAARRERAIGFGRNEVSVERHRRRCGRDARARRRTRVELVGKESRAEAR